MNLNGSLTPRSSSLTKSNDLMSRSMIIEKRPTTDMTKSYTDFRQVQSAKKVNLYSYFLPY